MAHTLPDLPYAFDALEPNIDAQTMEIHHDKHHAAYISKLNAAIEGNADLESKSIDELISNLSAVPQRSMGIRPKRILRSCRKAFCRLPDFLLGLCLLSSSTKLVEVEQLTLGISA